MLHFYEDINGWFDFEQLYRDAVVTAPRLCFPDATVAHFVEVGAWLGKSTAFMAVEAFNSGKAISFDVVDTWKGTPGDTLMRHYFNKHPAGPWGEFYANMERGGVWRSPHHTLERWPDGSTDEPYPIVTSDLLPGFRAIMLDSVRAASLYRDLSLDFVFIDGDHSYEAVQRDLAAWWPKVKVGGRLAGHDWHEPGVRLAVGASFRDAVEVVPGADFPSWRIIKTNE